MQQTIILQLAISVPLQRCFDYLLPEAVAVKDLQPGIRVKVPFGARTVVGVLLSIESTSELPIEQLKQAIEIIDVVPIFSCRLIELLRWVSRYYHHPLGEVMLATLPRWVRQGRELVVKRKIKKLQNCLLDSSEIEHDIPPELTKDQAEAVDAIKQSSGFSAYLLQGITGSGKTEVYLRLIEQAIAKKKQALVLVPEIGLTPQTMARFQRRFGEGIVVLHSNLSDGDRFRAWVAAGNGEASIVIGTRSAVFAPLQSLGVIVVDEEHDGSFKQFSGLRYSARDVAIMRAKIEGVPIVLGSATPSLESLYNVRQQRFVSLEMPNRTGEAKPPSFTVVDLRRQRLVHGVSPALLAAIDQHLSAGNQVLLFINQRGYAPAWLCHDCGWSAVCPACEVKLTLHKESNRLHCHHCGYQVQPVSCCPECYSESVTPVGVGTERLESYLSERFSSAGVVRVDRDSTQSKQRLYEILDDIQTQRARLLIGTQMLAKGHHFPHVTLVGIVSIDQGLFSGDFRALERMGQLIMQVAGRAGREKKAGEVWMQTHHPQHPLLTTLLKEGYAAFASALLEERQITGLPPYQYLAVFRAEAKQAARAEQFLLRLKQQCDRFASPGLSIEGPVVSPMARRAGYARYQLLLRAEQRKVLHPILARVLVYLEQDSGRYGVFWHVDVDPMELM